MRSRQGGFAVILGLVVLVLAVALLMGLFFVSGREEPPAAFNETKIGTPIPSDVLIVERDAKSAAGVIRELLSDPACSHEDLMDLGTAYILENQFLFAASAYEGAARVASTPSETAGALVNKAAALVYHGELDLAIEAVTVAAQASPQSEDVAWARYGIAVAANDPAHISLARDQLLTIDPNLRGEEVFAITGPVASVIIAGILSATTVTVYALTPPEDRKDIVVPLMQGYFRVAAVAAAAPTGISQVWGRQIVMDSIQ